MPKNSPPFILHALALNISFLSYNSNEIVNKGREVEIAPIGVRKREGGSRGEVIVRRGEAGRRGIALAISRAPSDGSKTQTTMIMKSSGNTSNTTASPSPTLTCPKN